MDNNHFQSLSSEAPQDQSLRISPQLEENLVSFIQATQTSFDRVRKNNEDMVKNQVIMNKNTGPLLRI